MISRKTENTKWYFAMHALIFSSRSPLIVLAVDATGLFFQVQSREVSFFLRRRFSHVGSFGHLSSVRHIESWFVSDGDVAVS